MEENDHRLYKVFTMMHLLLSVCHSSSPSRTANPPTPLQFDHLRLLSSYKRNRKEEKVTSLGL